MRYLACLLLAFALSGCATGRGIDEHIHFDPAGKTTIYRDQWVQRNPPEVHVKPITHEGAPLKALFIPFRVTQPIDNPDMLGYSLARVVWQTWLSMQLFPAMEFSGDSTPYRRDRAVQLGRMRGVDIVIGGFVTYIYAGGSGADSQVAIQLEVHDTHSGQLVWSMAQSGILPASRTNDYFLFATKSRMPSDPIQAIMQVIAGDMGKVVQNWTAGPPGPAQGMQKLDRQAHDVLFPPRDPVPAPRSSRTPEDQQDRNAF